MRSWALGEDDHLSSFVDDKRRYVIPRWRAFSTTVGLNELDPLALISNDVVGPFDDFSAKVARWRTVHTSSVAADLLASAVVLGKDADADVRAAADYLLIRREPNSVDRRVVARLVDAYADDQDHLAEDQQAFRRHRVHDLRLHLSVNPRNVVLWTDLSREYTILGQLRQAVRSIENALYLAPANRFVLRAATRLFMHMDDPGRAHDLLRRAHAVGRDPWLLAAEIVSASVAGHTSRHLKRGLALARDDAVPPYDKAELSSTIATLEMENGSNRSARKLFQTSLVKPTENSLAQVVFWQRHVNWLSGDDVSTSSQGVPRSYEAKAWKYFEAGNWTEAITSCRAWLLDEPYSVRPAMLGAFLALVPIGDPLEAKSLLESALVANGNYAGLHNNYAVALAEQGRLDDAEAALKTAWLHETDAVVRSIYLVATNGLIAFRRGEVERGRLFYLESIEAARRHGNAGAAVLAEAYRAREEALVAEEGGGLVLWPEPAARIPSYISAFIERGRDRA